MQAIASTLPKDVPPVKGVEGLRQSRRPSEAPDHHRGAALRERLQDQCRQLHAQANLVVRTTGQLDIQHAAENLASAFAVQVNEESAARRRQSCAIRDRVPTGCRR
jgi:hypothetical protein